MLHIAILWKFFKITGPYSGGSFYFLNSFYWQFFDWPFLLHIAKVSVDSMLTFLKMLLFWQNLGIRLDWGEYPQQEQNKVWDSLTADVWKRLTQSGKRVTRSCWASTCTASTTRHRAGDTSWAGTWFRWRNIEYSVLKGLGQEIEF